MIFKSYSCCSSIAIIILLSMKIFFSAFRQYLQQLQYYFIVMGQQASAQNQSSHSQADTYNLGKKKQAFKQKLSHEGILTIRKIPFENCQTLDINGQIFFLEPTRSHLKDLIKHKMRLQKYFGEREVIQIIQNLIYTLAFLQNVNYPYPCLATENIYIANGSFKLLPVECFSTNMYTKLKCTLKDKSQQYVPASPQMIIAARCQEKDISQLQILFKSNIFAVGMILLEVCTLKHSSQCYDLVSYDILDQIVTDRIEEIQGRYDGKVARVIANMLDYDFEQRISPKQFSVWINRQFNEGQERPLVKKKDLTPRRQKLQILTEPQRLIRSRIVEQKVCSNESDKIQDEIPNNNPRERKGGRMQQIRNKLIKQKIKVQKQILQQRELTRGKSQKKLKGERQKFLPNPYLNHNHLNKSRENLSKSPSYYQPKIEQKVCDSGFDEKKMKSNRYSYSKISFPEKPAQSKINLKYKYNLNSDENQKPQSVSAVNYKKIDGERFVRVEKYINQYQRTGLSSGKKYDYRQYYDQSPRAEERRFKNQEDEQMGRNEDKNQKISDFAQNLKRNEEKQSKVLVERQNNEKSGVQRKNEKQKKYSYPLERHQQYFRTHEKESGTEKREGHESQDMMLIKKEIERSRKLIEEVRKCQQQNQDY